MASVAHDFDSGAQGVFVNTISWSHTCTGTDLLLFVTMAYSLVPGMLVTSVTYNGVAMTVLGSTLTAPGGVKSVTYYLMNPATGAHNIVLNTDNAGDILDCNASSYNGVDTSTAPNIITTDVASASPTTTTGTTTVNNAWVALFGSGGQTAGTGATKRGSSHAQNGCNYDSNAAVTPAGSYSMTTSDVSNHAWKMVEFGPSLGVQQVLAASQGQTATLLTALLLTKSVLASQAQSAMLSAQVVPAPTEVSGGTAIQSVPGLRSQPWRLDLYNVHSFEDLQSRLPEIIRMIDEMLQWLFEDLNRVNDALGDGSPTGVDRVLNDVNVTGIVDGSDLQLGFTGQLSVSRGGTGRATADAYAVICGGTLPGNPHQSVVGLGTAGQKLTSNGAGMLPTWQ